MKKKEKMEGGSLHTSGLQYKHTLVPCVVFDVWCLAFHFATHRASSS
jgi:hypothetical protein